MWTRLRAYVTNRLHGRAIEHEVGEELRFHVEQETDRLIADGLSPAEARRTALRELGGVASTMQAVRSTRSLGVHALWLDVRYALRSLLAAPRFSLVALSTIVLTVGGIAAVFALVNAVLLRPLPYPDADRLVTVEATTSNGHGLAMSLDDLDRLLTAAGTLDRWAAYTPRYVHFLDRDTPEPVQVQDLRVTPSVFPMFGIQTVLGRPLLESDADPASPPVAVISYDLWQSRFGGKDVVGTLVPGQGDVVYTVVGVTAPDTRLPIGTLPFGMVFSALRKPYPGRSFVAVARLRDGATATMADDELRAADARLGGAASAPGGERTITVVSMLDRIVGPTKSVLWTFLAAVSFVLLIGVANLVSLQVVRNAARERELCLRAALGASRWRLVRQLLVETSMLGLVGGALGLAAAAGAIEVIVGALPAPFPRADSIRVDYAVVLFATAVSAGVALVWAILPGWRVSRPQLSAALAEGGRGSRTSARRNRLQRLMIGLETALALVLLVGAGLLVNSFGRMMTTPAGMDEANLWAAQIRLPNRYQSGQQASYWTDLLREVRTLGPVASAALSINDAGPLSGGDIGVLGVAPEGAPRRPDVLRFSIRNVSGGYFETLGTPVVEGRPILDSDTPGSERVVVLNELAARMLWPDTSAIGKRITGLTVGPARVVGIIPTFTITDIQSEPSAQIYVPASQTSGYPAATLMFRPQAGTTGADDAVATVARSLEPDVRVDVRTMTAVRWNQLAMERFRTTVLLVFAGTAVFLAIVGILGVVSYSVVQRAQEVAIRIALGATRGQVTTLLMRQVLVPSLVGLLVGTAAALGLSRSLSAFLFDITPTDPATYVAAIVLLASAAVLAALLPARRANALEALRHE